MIWRLVGELDGVGVAIDVVVGEGYIVHAHSAKGECWRAEEVYPYEPSYQELVASHAEGAG